MEKREFEYYKKSGKIAGKVRKYVREMIKPGMKLVDIADKIEGKIEELGGECAFPVNLSVDDVAAHNHPDLESEEVARGLLKVDMGIHVKGFIADTALSLDLSEDGKYKRLVKASEDAVERALKLIKDNPKVSLSDIGEKIQKVIESKGFSPVVNLSGHSLGEYQVHAGVTIPNYANGNGNHLVDGAYAIEPFATDGEGRIYEGNSGGVYAVVDPKNVRGAKAREILDYVWKKYKTLPFSLREIQKKFGGFARLGLRELEGAGIIRGYGQLIEKGHGAVSQAEHSFVLKKGRVIVLTDE